MDIFEILSVVVGTFLSVSMFTTLYGKSNPLYSLAEESYIGFATALTVVVNIMYIYSTGIIGIQAGDWVLVFGIILGCMILFRIVPKYSYIAKIPIAICVGAQLGLALRTIVFTGFISQIQATVVPLFSGNSTTLLYNWTISISVITMLTFFFYTTELKGPLGWSAKIGEYIMYASFGGIFAQTFMGRLGLFTGFMQTYMTPQWKIPYLLGNLVLGFAIVIILDKTKLLKKLTPEE